MHINYSIAYRFLHFAVGALDSKAHRHMGLVPLSPLDLCQQCCRSQSRHGSTVFQQPEGKGLSATCLDNSQEFYEKKQV